MAHFNRKKENSLVQVFVAYKKFTPVVVVDQSLGKSAIFKATMIWAKQRFKHTVGNLINVLQS